MAAITNLGTLNTAVSQYYPDGPRTDITAAMLTDFLNFTQSKLYCGDGVSEPLRIRQMIASANLTPNASGAVTISTGVAIGWLEFIEITPATNGALSLNYLTPWAFRKQSSLLADTTPPATIYTTEGDSLLVAARSSATLAAVWYQKFTAMTLDADTDWLLTNAPQVYLNGLLAEACGFFAAPEEPVYRAKFTSGVAALNLNDKRARASGAVAWARPRGVA